MGTLGSGDQTLLIIDVGKFGRAKLHKLTLLELLGFIAMLVALIVFFR